MTAILEHVVSEQTPATPPRDWVRILAHYRTPNSWRSIFEIVVTVVPFIAIWALAWWALAISPWLSLALGMLNGIFLVRIFMIQHDCGHGSFLHSRKLGDWVGRILGVLTVTPYDVWRRSHSAHHSSSGNLDKRGLGDIHTLTVAEYRELGRFDRWRYRLYRHPFVLFAVGPSYVFLLENRLPLGHMRAGWVVWASAMGTNAMIALMLAVIYSQGGWMPILLIFLPGVLVASTIGVWLFYIQHQFEETWWDEDKDWQLHDAALHGSSHYDLPPILHWFTANIGVHHVHHLYARIPFYRLSEVLRDHVELAEAQKLSIRESFACVGLNLWDEKTRRLLTFRDERALYGPI